MELKELNEKIIEWAKDREIDKKGTIEGQAIKTIEEMSELIKGICKDDIDLIKDSIGDVYVTLVIGCILSGLDGMDFDDLRRQFLGATNEYENKIDLIFDLGFGIKEISMLASDERGVYVEDYSKYIYNGACLRIIFVALLDAVAFYRTTLEECVELAYKEISGRKGKMIDGVFVKEEDLKN